MALTVNDMVRDVRVALDENRSLAPFETGDGAFEDDDMLEMEDIIVAKIADGVNAVRRVAPLGLLDIKSTQPEVTWINARRGIGSIELPSDFLRLAMVKMRDWAYGVTELTGADSDLYRQQWSEWGGVRGNPSRPVAALSIGDVPLFIGGGTIIGGKTQADSVDDVAADETTAAADDGITLPGGGTTLPGGGGTTLPGGGGTTLTVKGKVIELFSSPNLIMLPGEKTVKAELHYVARLDAVGQLTDSLTLEDGLRRAMVLKTASLVAANYGGTDMAALLNTMAEEAMGLQKGNN